MSALRLVDIGANLLDERYQGVYRGSQRHEPDLDLVMERAVHAGVNRILLTAGTVEESRQAVTTCRQWNVKYPLIRFACTVGVHPTRCQQVFLDNNADADDLLSELLDTARDGMKDGTVAAIGEIGLDYDRLEFCPKTVQQAYFKRQLQTLAKQTRLPLFLHNRNVGDDLYDILSAHHDCWHAGGVVHSFDDTIDLASQFMNGLGLYIGLNGCSLRTDHNLNVVRELPLNRILLETDCPYCDVRSTHAGYQYVQTKYDACSEKKFTKGKVVKNRQEPCHVQQIAEIVAGVQQVNVETVVNQCYENASSLFQWIPSTEANDKKSASN